MISRKWILKKELLLFGILTVFCDLDDVLRFLHERRHSVLRFFCIWRLCTPHGNDAIFFQRNNFPTQYPHYGGQDVKYHFMFQFLVGNLEYLGFRLDLGYIW